MEVGERVEHKDVHTNDTFWKLFNGYVIESVPEFGTVKVKWLEAGHPFTMIHSTNQLILRKECTKCKKYIKKE